MNMDLHSTGASFVAAKEDNNPREIVIEVIKSAPNATRKEQFDQFRERLSENSDEYQRAVDWYFFVNMHDYLTTSRNTKSTPAQRAAQKESQAKTVEAIKDQIVILNLVMPNGKMMRDCTGAEMTMFGGSFVKVGKKVGSAKTVGSVLDEKQIRQFMK